MISADAIYQSVSKGPQRLGDMNDVHLLNAFRKLRAQLRFEDAASEANYPRCVLLSQMADVLAQRNLDPDAPREVAP